MFYYLCSFLLFDKNLNPCRMALTKMLCNGKAFFIVPSEIPQENTIENYCLKPLKKN